MNKLNEGTAYLFQASLIIIWWILITINEDIYQFFSYSSISKESYFALLVPDLLLLGVLSLIRAYKMSRDLNLIILGAFAYATFFCINASILGLDGLVPTITMVFGLCFNIYLCYPVFFSRSSGSNSVWINAFKTFVQIISFWTLFLVAIPYLILYSSKTELSLIDNDFTMIISLLVFVSASLLGIFSAYFMVSKGKGTPLPVDATNTLVTSGPYEYIRNPMAVAGVGQIFAIAIAFSSLHIAIYALIGALGWHFIVRPVEESDLENKFGNQYTDYKKRTRCWIPVKKEKFI